jgi:hypothetical protein
VHDGETGQYTADLYSLRNGRKPADQQCYFFWYLRIKDWNYFFINGKMPLYTSMTAAVLGIPVYLGGKCTWNVTTKPRGKMTVVSAGLKDPNGSTLRMVTGPGGNLSPRLRLSRDGGTVSSTKMEFG